MFQFVTKIAKKKEAEQLSRADKYRKLIMRAAVDDDLSDREAVELGELHTEFGHGSDLVEVAEALRERNGLLADAAELETAKKTYWATSSAVSAYDAETKRQVEALQKAREAGREVPHSAWIKAKDRENCVTAAANRKREVEEKYWFVFGEYDPVDARANQRSRRHIVHYLAELKTEGAAYPVVFAEGPLDPNYPPLDGDPRSYQWVPLPGQTDEEVESLVDALARACTRHDRCFLIPKKNAYPRIHPAISRSVKHFEDALAAVAKGYNPNKDHFIEHPGQSWEELIELKSKLIDAFNETQKR